MIMLVVIANIFLICYIPYFLKFKYVFNFKKYEYLTNFKWWL